MTPDDIARIMVTGAVREIRRDLFAGLALHALTRSDELEDGETYEHYIAVVTEAAYQYADAMLKAREPRQAAAPEAKP